MKPEDRIATAIKKKLREEGWDYIKTHGNQFQSGLPDLYAFHKVYGTRWIETKTMTGHLTQAQRVVFNKFHKRGVSIYIMTSVKDYPCLFKPSNWYWFDDIKQRRAMFKG